MTGNKRSDGVWKTPQQRDLFLRIRNGPATALFHAQQSLTLWYYIGDHVNEVKAAGFNDFGGTLQVIFQSRLLVEVSKVFEEENPRFDQMGIPSVLSALHRDRDHLKLLDPPAVASFLERAGDDPAQITGLTSDELHGRLINVSRDVLDGGRVVPHWGDVSDARKRVHTIRSKQLVHAERIDAETLPRPTWGAIEDAMQFAKEFVGAVGAGYCNSVWMSDDGTFAYDSDAYRATGALERLFRDAGVVPKRQ